jgi:hypothetical protein
MHQTTTMCAQNGIQDPPTTFCKHMQPLPNDDEGKQNREQYKDLYALLTSQEKKRKIRNVNDETKKKRRGTHVRSRHQSRANIKCTTQAPV